MLPTAKSILSREAGSLRLPRPQTVLALLIFGTVFGYHWFKIWAFAVDVPFWDEWRMIQPVSAGDWLWRQEGEHRMVTTKLIISALWHLNGWDLTFHQTLNFFIFGLVLLSLGWLIRIAVPSFPSAPLVLLLTFALSPRASEIHHWALTGHYHWALLFFFLCAALLFRSSEERQTTARLAGGVIFGILAIYSFGIVLPGMALVVLVYCGFKYRRANLTPDSKTLEMSQAAAVCLCLSLALAAYKIGYHKPDSHPNLTMPSSSLFWDHFVTLAANGLGYKPGLPGDFLICGTLAVIGITAWSFASRQRAEQGSPVLLAIAILGILGAMAGTTVGRAGFGIDQAYAGRYTEVTMMLIPLLGALFWLGFARVPKIRVGVLATYVVFCGYGFYQSIPLFNDYDLTYYIRRLEARHLSHCYANREACTVVNLNPGPISPETLDLARQQNMSFSRKLVLNQW